jgi:hypothetical protein
MMIFHGVYRQGPYALDAEGARLFDQVRTIASNDGATVANILIAHDSRVEFFTSVVLS